MRQLINNEFSQVGGGCSSCQKNMLSTTVAAFNGTLLGMAIGGGAFMLSAPLPVAIGAGVLAFASVSYYSYYNVMDSFIDLPAA